MNNKLTSSQWLKRFIALVLAVLVILAAAVYIIDPYYHYRAYDNKYKIDKIFSVPGVVKNYDYDTIIIGSSMTQNFDPETFRQELGQNPVKATIGGMDNPEVAALLKLAQDSGHAENYYLCIDNSMLNSDDGEERFPQYLLDDNVFNDYRYFWGYEAWMRFIPLDLGLVLADKLGITLPSRFNDARSIDRMGDWAYLYNFGADYVLERYAKSSTGGASNVDMTTVYDTSFETCDALLDSLDLSQGNITVYFPPYSALLWYTLQQSGTLDDMLAIKQHFVERISQYDNVTIYDFQGAEFTADLDNYMDLSHHSTEINDYIVHCFATGEYKATLDTLTTKEQIEQNISTLLETYPQIPTLR
jgi:hypothetical protein